MARLQRHLTITRDFNTLLELDLGGRIAVSTIDNDGNMNIDLVNYEPVQTTAAPEGAAAPEVEMTITAAPEPKPKPKAKPRAKATTKKEKS